MIPTEKGAQYVATPTPYGQQNDIVGNVVDQHVDELVILWTTRRLLVRSSHAALRHLERFDERIAAHQDGCVVAGDHAVARLTASLAEPDAGELFAAGCVALATQQIEAFERCVLVAEALEDDERIGGLKSALGWADAANLTGVVRDMLAAPSPVRRQLGLAACRMHSVDPGSLLAVSLNDADHRVRAEASRIVAALGRRELVSTLSMVASAKSDFWLIWASVFLGDRNRALDELTRYALTPSANRSCALRLAMQAHTVRNSHSVLQRVASSTKEMRTLIEGSGVVGDPSYVPWLIGHMENDQTARLAGEAFSLLTGTDLALLDLERKPPENFESGPNDDPGDPNVHMDPDDGLPWPDPDLVKDWWSKNSSRFQPGTRYFMGAPVTHEHCVDVLKNGYQRQRILAAHYLCLLEPGTPLFNTSAPAWRQQRLLAGMK